MELRQHSAISADCWISKNVEKCVQLIKQLLSESQKPWNMTQSPLYYRYEDTAQGKAFSGIGKNFVRELYSEIEIRKSMNS